MPAAAERPWCWSIRAGARPGSGRRRWPARRPVAADQVRRPGCRPVRVLRHRELGQEDPPVYDRLGQVRAPAVMVRGDLEYPMVADCSDAIASRIPGCSRILVPGADHLLPLRAPGRLAEIITDQAGTAAL